MRGGSPRYRQRHVGDDHGEAGALSFGEDIEFGAAGGAKGRKHKAERGNRDSGIAEAFVQNGCRVLVTVFSSKSRACRIVSIGRGPERSTSGRRFKDQRMPYSRRWVTGETRPNGPQIRGGGARPSSNVPSGVGSATPPCSNRPDSRQSDGRGVIDLYVRGGRARGARGVQFYEGGSLSGGRRPGGVRSANGFAASGRWRPAPSREIQAITEPADELILGRVRFTRRCGRTTTPKKSRPSPISAGNLKRAHSVHCTSFDHAGRAFLAGKLFARSHADQGAEERRGDPRLFFYGTFFLFCCNGGPGGLECSTRCCSLKGLGEGLFPAQRSLDGRKRLLEGARGGGGGSLMSARINGRARKMRRQRSGFTEKNRRTGGAGCPVTGHSVALRRRATRGTKRRRT